MCKLKEFSPTSRDHIAFAFETFRGWEPTERTASGRAKIDDTVLREVGTEEALKFARILELQKHLGQLSDGKNAWLKLERKGKIHHSCFLNTNTGRQAHSSPNAAQTPSAREYRELFYPGKGRVQVGCDASGLELRCLGHILHPFDGGKFAKEVVEGDIHSKLASIYGTDRSTSKGVTYSMIYGGGDNKIGTVAGASKSKATAKGKEIRKRIMDGLDGFAELNKAIQSRAETDVLKGLDGRPIRLQGKRHAALNYCLQSMGAVLCKAYLLRINEMLQEAGIDYTPLGFIHDEVQLSVAPSQAKQAGEITTYAMKDVQHQFRFRCALDSEYKIGNSWADCH
jgi:DNA polymerase I-like protein with 3'-5' exonuclease and polymerase domains